MARRRCSPLAWGWSELGREVHFLEGAPHSRGDGPVYCWDWVRSMGCSPLAWGWSDVVSGRHFGGLVLPTRVGMVRGSHPKSLSAFCAPHSRGDGPSSSGPHPRPLACSPLAWGWSAVGCDTAAYGQVLPTRVGMVRSATLRMGFTGRAPHSRGDGPPQSHGGRKPELCSPLAWGWSSAPGCEH